jgi:hypothetical protein
MDFRYTQPEFCICTKTWVIAANHLPGSRSREALYRRCYKLVAATLPVRPDRMRLVLFAKPERPLPQNRRRPSAYCDERAAARARSCPFCFLRGEEPRSLNCAFSLETSSRSAASSFCTPLDPGSTFDSLAGGGTDGRVAELGIQGRKRLAADDAAVEAK